MRKMLLGIVAMFFVASVVAHAGPQGPAPKPFAMDLGTEFTTLFVSCGTPVNPDCPRWNGPVGRPFMIHYIVAGGRSTDLCSAFVQIKRMIPGGGEEIIQLFRLVFSSGTSADNVVLALPKPIRVGPDDLVGVARAQGTCAILGTIGIELTK
jgi:hypothetical protein